MPFRQLLFCSLSALFFCGIQTRVFSQTEKLQAEVFSIGGKPLKAAIRFENQWFETDSSGKLSLNWPPERESVLLLVTAPGFEADSHLLKKPGKIRLSLSELLELPGVEVKAARQSAFLEKTAVVKTEVINRQELKKAACCDLAGCFETQGTVQPQVSNVLSNAKELRILGLSGVYNQLLVDGSPVLLGLSFPYGISGIPGPLVENIYVSKGANSVLQGFESISGQINVLTSDPENAEKVKISLYGNQFGEAHLNAAAAAGKGQHRMIFGLHGVSPANRRDRDGDGFLDVTRLQRKMAFVNGKWSGEELSGEYGLRFTREDRSSGQYLFNPENDRGSNRIYGQSIGFSQLDGRKRIEYRYRSNQRLLLQLAGQLHQQDSWFGTLHYLGRQGLFYGNLQHELLWRGHSLKSGISQRLLTAEETIGLNGDQTLRSYQGSYLKKEIIPGFFAENTFSFREDRIKLIAGLRADHHNRLGWKVVPRLMFRWDIGENSILRANAGRGWRTVNLFTDHAQVLAGNRNLLIGDNLQAESAWNAGLSFTQNFDSRGISGYFSGDAYYTSFQNQVFPDYLGGGTVVRLANFGGISRSLYGQAEGKVNFPGGLSLRFSYSFTENYRIGNGQRNILPFTPIHRGLLAVSWRKPGFKWQFDLNQHLYGPQVLPDTRDLPETYRREDSRSPAYQLLNLQVIRFLGKVELYAGCENVFDFRQRKPMTAWQDPFGPWFDTAGVWGPTRGREFYGGLRFRIP